MSEVHDPNERPIEMAGFTGNKSVFGDTQDKRLAEDAGLDQLQDPEFAEAADDSADSPAEPAQGDERITGEPDPGTGTGLDTAADSGTGTGAGVDVEEARARAREEVAEAIRDDDR